MKKFEIIINVCVWAWHEAIATCCDCLPKANQNFDYVKIFASCQTPNTNVNQW